MSLFSRELNCIKTWHRALWNAYLAKTDEVSLSHVCVHSQLLREKGVKDRYSGQQQKELVPSAPGDPVFKARALL